jgi:hypothetical protein
LLTPSWEGCVAAAWQGVDRFCRAGGDSKQRHIPGTYIARSALKKLSDCLGASTRLVPKRFVNIVWELSIHPEAPQISSMNESHFKC